MIPITESTDLIFELSSFVRFQFEAHFLPQNRHHF